MGGGGRFTVSLSGLEAFEPEVRLSGMGGDRVGRHCAGVDREPARCAQATVLAKGYRSKDQRVDVYVGDAQKLHEYASARGIEEILSPR